MATPQQKAEDRPISFVFHNMATGEDPVEVPLVLRPEDLTRTDTSRQTVTQTLGGAFLDDFGRGVPTVQISGHTGWGAGNRKDGLAEFQNLYDTIFTRWHAERAAAVESNLDPDKVRLIFADKLDDFVWVVAPQNFTLRRSRSRPLLSQYQINLTWLSDDVRETMSALDAIKAADALDQKKNALESFAATVEKLGKSIGNKITAVLGPIQRAVDRFTRFTTNVLGAVNQIVRGVLQVPAALATNGLNLALSLSKAASNIYHSVAAVAAIPMIAKSYFMQVASEFENAFCILKNVLKPRLLLPNYDALYGASNCSSTAGGSPISIYDLLNPFNVYQPPVKTGSVYIESVDKDGKPDGGGWFKDGKPVPASVSDALNKLEHMDPANPLPKEEIARLSDIVSGAGR